MASASVYYRFKSQREPSRITFDGTGISVWDLKREIILQNKMGKGLDFDLAVYNQDTEEEIKDDNFIIPRSSQVLVRRLPPSKPGRGSAADYVADLQAGGPNSTVVEPPRTSADPSRRPQSYRGQMSMRFDGKDANTSTAAADVPDIQSMSTAGIEGDEASKIAAMFQASSEQWDETQERMAHATYRDRPGAPPRRTVRPLPHNTQPSPAHDRPPPIGYICFRCGTKGHWIQDCPTNEDRDFDNKPRFKRTTGIPKSMLKSIEAPADGVLREGVMVTPDGNYVVAQVDSASWARNQAFRQKRLTKSNIYDSVPSDPKLACSVCNKLLRDAVRTPCCGTLFCQDCITNSLLEHDFQCPECEKRVKDLTDLKRDDETRKQVREYVDNEMDKSEKKLQEAEQAEKDEIEKAQKEKEQQNTEADAEDTQQQQQPDAAQETKQEHEDTDANADNLQEGSEWNPQAVQQIMMMLSNPQLPPPMRMQLQMQLRFLQNQFMQMVMHQKGNTDDGSMDIQQRQQMQLQMQQQQRQSMLGAHTGNPFAGQHQVMTPGMMGMMNPMAAFSMPAQNKFRPSAPLSHQESAYMRLPVNANKRTTGVKRERPADFLEVGGGNK